MIHSQLDTLFQKYVTHEFQAEDLKHIKLPTERARLKGEEKDLFSKVCFGYPFLYIKQQDIGLSQKRSFILI